MRHRCATCSVSYPNVLRVPRYCRRHIHSMFTPFVILVGAERRDWFISEPGRFIFPGCRVMALFGGEGIRGGIERLWERDSFTASLFGQAAHPTSGLKPGPREVY